MVDLKCDADNAQKSPQGDNFIETDKSTNSSDVTPEEESEERKTIEDLLESISGRAEEAECKTAFTEMKNPETKIKYHFNWRPLYDQYMKNPSDYEGFKREYTAYRVSERNKLESMIDLKSRNELELMTDEKSVQGKALLVERIRIKKKEKAIRDMKPVRVKESKCRRLFNELKQPLIKKKYYLAYKPLHDHFVRDPSDYEGFKREYTAYLKDERRKQNEMQDPSSAEGKALAMEKMKHDFLDLMINEAIIKNLDDVLPAELRVIFNEIFYSRRTLAKTRYIKIAVNGVTNFVLVDSGCDCSFMSLSFARMVDLESEIDTAKAHGVLGCGGREQMIGIIDSFFLETGNTKFEAKVSVSEHDNDDVIIGIDFLRAHNCSIDLEKNRLTFNRTIHVNFATDSEMEPIERVRRYSFLKVDDDKLNEIVAMGFDKSEAENALLNKLNDTSQAVCSLYTDMALEAWKIENGLGTDVEQSQPSAEGTTKQLRQAKDRSTMPRNARNRKRIKPRNVNEADKKIKDTSKSSKSTKNETVIVLAKQILDKKNNTKETEQNCTQLNEALNNMDIKCEAIEQIPEDSEHSQRLFIHLTVNNTPAIAFVDTGAATTSISSYFARKCGLDHMVDSRNQSIVYGFGGGDRTDGVMFSCTFEIEGCVFENTQIHVINDEHDVVIGIDFLNKSKCTIDLDRNRITFRGSMFVEFIVDPEIEKIIEANPIL